MAEGIFRKLLEEKNMSGIDVFSAGMLTLDGLSPSENAIAAMALKQIDISDYRATQINKALVADMDLILVMTRVHKEALLDNFGCVETHTLGEFAGDDTDVLDPYGKDLDAYVITLEDIEGKAKKIISKLV